MKIEIKKKQRKEIINTLKKGGEIEIGDIGTLKMSVFEKRNNVYKKDKLDIHQKIKFKKTKEFKDDLKK